MSAHGPSARHAHIHEDGMPLADRPPSMEEEIAIWMDIIARTPIQRPQPFRRNR